MASKNPPNSDSEFSNSRSAYLTGLVAKPASKQPQNPLPRPRTQKEIMPQSDDVSIMGREDTGANLKPIDSPGGSSDKKNDALEPLTSDKKNKLTKLVKKKSTSRKPTGNDNSAKRDPSIEDTNKTASKRKKNGPTIEHLPQAQESSLMDGGTLKQCGCKEGCSSKVGIQGHSIPIVGGQFMFESGAFNLCRVLTKEQWEECKTNESCVYIAILQKAPETKSAKAAEKEDDKMSVGRRKRKDQLMTQQNVTDESPAKDDKGKKNLRKSTLRGKKNTAGRSGVRRDKSTEEKTTSQRQPGKVPSSPKKR